MHETLHEAVPDAQTHADRALSPTDAVHEVVRKAMTACFASDGHCPRRRREDSIRDVQTLTHVVARQWLVPAPDDAHAQEHESGGTSGPRTTVLRPWAYFSFQDSGQLHVPIIDWRAFRGYTVALWLNVDFGPRPSTSNDADATFHLFRFTNSAETLGVDASLAYIDKASPQDPRVVITVRCGAPRRAADAKKAASVTAASPASAWTTIQEPIHFVPGHWHFLVLSHSLHYVKKSKVTCYVDTTLQFETALVYPTGLATASKCTVGGGCHARAKVASVSMYHDEVAQGTMDFMYTLGPVQSSFTRWSAAVPAPSSRRLEDDGAPLDVPVPDAFAAYCKLPIVFSFHAHERGQEDYADRGVEWVSEGLAPSARGKWLAFETTGGTAASTAMQQRTARLGPKTRKHVFPDYATAWDRALGLGSIPVLLDYLLTAYERVRHAPAQADATPGARPLETIMESVVIDLLWIFKGLLRLDVANQQLVVKKYVFHVLSHVFVQHPACLAVVWTPASLVVCVDMVQSLVSFTPPLVDADATHPCHALIWTTHPVFAAAVRALLFDYRLWTHVDPKAQSIYNHQLYRLACAFPRAFNHLDAVTRVLSILATYYVASPAVARSSHVDEMNSQFQFTALDAKARQWTQQSVQSLVEVIEVCLTNQSTQLHALMEHEGVDTGASPTSMNGSSSSPSSATPPTSGTPLSMPRASRKRAGVFTIHLEHIVWSDQTPAASSVSSDEGTTRARTSVLSCIHVRCSLLRDLRAILCFVLTSSDAAVCTSLVHLLRRLAVSFLDVRVALVTSCILDCLLDLMHAPDAADGGRVHVRLASLPLFLYLLDWLASIEGRTVWCGMDEDVRRVWKRHGTLSRAVLDVLLEVYVDPTTALGIQHSILMNDPTMHASRLFPMATSGTEEDDGIAVVASSAGDGGAAGRVEWMPRANVGKRLHLTWEKRLAVLRLAAVRRLSTGWGPPDSVAELVDEGMRGLGSLPVPTTLPFLPLLVARCSVACRDQVVMDLHVKLKTNDALQRQLLAMEQAWAHALVELAVTCTLGHELAVTTENDRTGQDLVLDTVVSLLCLAMTQAHGDRAFTHVLVALRAMHAKYAAHDVSAPCDVVAAPLTWMSRVVGTVLHRMASTRTMLSRIVADNIERVLVLVDESLVRPWSAPGAERSGQWTDTHVGVLEAVLDMCARLVDCRHKLYRKGLAPGLAILQRALPVIQDDAMLARTVQLLTQTCQQQVTACATLSIQDTVSTRVVLLRALSALRRALLLHTSADALACLRDLTWKICTSGVFEDELRARTVSMQERSDGTDARAVDTMLDALAIVINDNEGYDREAAAATVPSFPMAQALAPRELARSRDVDWVDETHRVLYAALEVEENRMTATIRDGRTQCARATTVHDAPQQREWTHALWRELEWTFRSVHVYHALRHAAPETYHALLATRVWRLGRYETPFPSRTRWTVEVDVALSYDKVQALKRARRARHVTAVGPRPLERDDPSALTLLAHVGRVLAKERGGEIQDITSDEGVADSSGSHDKEALSVDDAMEVERKEDAEREDKTSEARPDPRVDNADHVGLDPGPGIAVSPDDHVYASVTCRRVVPEGHILGRLSLCGRHMAFEPRRDRDASLHGRASAFDDRLLPFAPSVEEAAPGLHRCWRWKYAHVMGVYLRRYRLRDSGLEVFLANGTAHFLDLPCTTPARRNDFVRLLYTCLARKIPKQWPGQPLAHLDATTRAWQARALSNFDYLMALNTFAGRSVNDLTQYPVFPWILATYDSATLDVRDPATFRDLSKPVGALNPTRLSEYWDRYHAFDDAVIPKFLYGSHYSTCAGVVLFFLARLEPFATLHQTMQGGAFDLPDRLFASLDETWTLCQSHMSEVKELTPEFFASDGAFLTNRNAYDLGTRQDGHVVDDVVLPPWARSPADFVRRHRAALESDHVSAHLHEWIDLIFGAKQRGRAALDAHNVFYYLTYYGVVDLDHVADPGVRESMEHQIAHFGQCPMQLFRAPHPPRARGGVGLSPSSSASSSTSPWVSRSPRSGPDRALGAARHLSLAFQDHSFEAQARRRDASTVATVPGLGPSGLRLVQTLADRIVTVNALGVVELFAWRVVPRPPTTSSEQEQEHACPWVLEVTRVASPRDAVPRIPVWSDALPVVTSRNGRVVASGGARNGALHFRLVDLDTGHVVGKASVVGHGAAVTCLSVDRWRSHRHTDVGHAVDDDDDDVLVSGAGDGSLAVWRLSRLSLDLLLVRVPRVSPRPLHVLRGHAHALVDCVVDTDLGLVASCTASVGLLHCLHAPDAVACVVEPARSTSTFVRLGLSRKGYVVALMRLQDGTYALDVWTLSGTRLASRPLGAAAADVTDMHVATDGDVVVVTLAPETLRLYRVDDLVLVQEYAPPRTPASSRITAMCVGPKEALVVLACGYDDGTLSLQLLPDAQGAVALLAHVRRGLGVAATLKRVTGPVHHAQTLALSTYDNARDLTSTARDIAGEALGEAKGLMRGLFKTLTRYGDDRP